MLASLAVGNSRDTGSRRGPAVENSAELPSMQERLARAKLTFHEKFEHTLAYQKLNHMSRFQQSRFELQEEACGGVEAR